MKNILRLLLLPIYGIPLLFTCCTNGITTDPTSRAYEYYKLLSNSDVKLLTEFKTYYFLPSETRNIMIYGHDKENTIYNFWDDKYDRNEDNMIKQTTNDSYLDKDDYYTTTYSFNNGLNYYVTYDLMIYGGLYPNAVCSTMVKIAAIPQRQYSIHMNSMASYNFLTVGYNIKDTINKAFSYSNTFMDFRSTPSLNIPDQIIHIDDTNLETIALSFLEWTERYIMQTDYRFNGVWVYSIWKCDSQKRTGQLLGSTYTSSYLDPITLKEVGVDKHCFIFNNVIDAVSSQANLDEISHKKLVNLTTIHELGHARGLNLTIVEGYPVEHDITDDLHTKGHNGIHNSQCLMRYYDINSIKSILNGETVFCNGHNQMLYNCIFQEK